MKTILNQEQYIIVSPGEQQFLWPRIQLRLVTFPTLRNITYKVVILTKYFLPSYFNQFALIIIFKWYVKGIPVFIGKWKFDDLFLAKAHCIVVFLLFVMMHADHYNLLPFFTGKGQFGDVFLAKAHCIVDGQPDTLVVVKSLLTRDDRWTLEFRREMEMYARLNHEHVAKVLGHCREMEPQFLISEYCDWVSVLVTYFHNVWKKEQDKI